MERTGHARELHEIAREIERDWGARVSPHARPYLDAMRTLRTLDDNYYADSGDSVVTYFLANAQTWRGEIARRVKAELNAMLHAHREY